jgi:hypothetical protein
MWQWDQYRNESHHESHYIFICSHAIKALIADNIKQIHPIHLKSNMFYKIARFYKFSKRTDKDMNDFPTAILTFCSKIANEI